MNLNEFELSCASYLSERYAHYDCHFLVSGGFDSSSPDIVVSKNGKHLCNIEVKEPNAQCSQFVAFPDQATRSFIYSPMNHPSMASDSSAAILQEMAKDFDRYKKPSSKELGLDKELYYNRIIDYYTEYKDSQFFITRESIEYGEFIIFPTNALRDYFNVSACYRQKKSGSHNPNIKERDALSEVLIKNNIEAIDIIHNGKYTDILLKSDCGDRFIIASSIDFQFKRIYDKLYRVTCLGKTNNPNVIFSISPKLPWKEPDWRSFESFITD